MTPDDLPGDDAQAGDHRASDAPIGASQPRDGLRKRRHRDVDRVRAYRRKYDAEHPDQAEKKRVAERRRLQRLKVARARAEHRREYGRAYYAKNRDAYAAAQKAARERRREADPERYRAQARARLQRWYDRHRTEQNAKLRDKYRENPDFYRQKSFTYYYANRERILAQRKAARDADPDAARARQRRHRQREKRRIEAGLPPYRLHRSTPAERRAHQDEAAIFFTTALSAERVRVNLAEPPTPPELIAAWERECARQRADHHIATNATTRGRVTDMIARPSTTVSGASMGDRAETRAAEDARMDAIARAINDQLRRTPRPGLRTDPAAPHAPGAPSPFGGLSR